MGEPPSGVRNSACPIFLFWSHNLQSYYVIGLLTDKPFLVWEPPSRERNLVSFQIFITNCHSKVRLLLTNIKVSLYKSCTAILIYLFEEFDYTLKYTVCELKLGRSREAFLIFGSRKICHHSGYPYINNQCSSLVDICMQIKDVITRKNRCFHWWFSFRNIRFGLLDVYGCKWGISEARYRAYWWSAEIGQRIRW